jgi:hypothetical protein
MKRRQWITLAVVTALALVAVLAWHLRADYFLWRMRAHDHGPSRARLADMGPKALPRIYAEIAALGKGEAGEYRADLVLAMRDIRHDFVEHEIGSPVLWEVHAALLPVDEAMANAVKTAFLNEPDAERRRDMLGRLGEHDFAMGVRCFCDLFGSASPMERFILVEDLRSDVLLVTEDKPPTDPYYPWRKLGKDEIAALRGQMKKQLVACAVPVLLDGVEKIVDRGGPAEGDETSLFLSSLDTLSAMKEMDGRIGKTFWDLLPILRNKIAATYLLDAMFGRASASAAKLAAQDLDRLAGVFQKSAWESRAGVLFWLNDFGGKGRVSPADLCRFLPNAPDQERFFTLDSLLAAPAGDLLPCISPLVTAMESAVVESSASEPPLWFATARDVLVHICGAGEDAAGQLGLLRSTVKQPSVIAAIDQAMDQAGEKNTLAKSP